MKTLSALVGRHIKMFFKDKGTFFTSLIAPLILLVLFVLFLGNVYRDSFYSSVPADIVVPDKVIEGFVGGWLLSSLLAVSCVTVAFCANMQIVQDKVTGAIGDFSVTPYKKSYLALSYYLATAAVTAAICYVALGAGFIYLACVGWYISAGDALFIVLDVFLLSLFGTALSSVICSFIKTQGGSTAVSVVVSSVYGFISGAYMPISQFANGIQIFVSLLPGTYGTGLFRNHFMGGVLAEIGNYFPPEVVDGIRTSFDCNMFFFGHKVEVGTMFLILGVTVAVLIGVYVLLHLLKKRAKN